MKSQEVNTMSKEAEKEIKISPRKLKRIKRTLAEIQALKKALGWEEKEENPGITNLDLLLFMVSMDGKLSWLLGAIVTAVALLIALAVAVF